MAAKLIERIENAEISFVQGLLGFTGIVILRFFFENISSPTYQFPGGVDMLALMHYFLFQIEGPFLLALAISLFVPDISKNNEIFALWAADYMAFANIRSYYLREARAAYGIYFYRRWFLLAEFYDAW